MLSESEARKLVETSFGNDQETDPKARFVLTECYLSPREDYWIISGNAAGFVENDDSDYCVIGYSWTLIDVKTGEMQHFGTNVWPEEYLQNEYAEHDANEQHYVLVSDYTETPKKQFIALKNWLGCGLSTTKELLCGNHTQWLTGPLTLLTKMQGELDDFDIKTSVVLMKDYGSALEVGPSYVPYWAKETLREYLVERAQKIEES